MLAGKVEGFVTQEQRIKEYDEGVLEDKRLMRQIRAKHRSKTRNEQISKEKKLATFTQMISISIHTLYCTGYKIFTILHMIFQCPSYILYFAGKAKLGYRISKIRIKVRIIRITII